MTDDFSLQKVNHQELMKLALKTTRANQSLMIRGGVGLGKTDSVTELAHIEAKRLDRELLVWVDLEHDVRVRLAEDDEFLKKHYLLCVFDTLNKLPEDMGGIPVPQAGGWVEWVPPMLFKILSKKNAAGVLFLDEFMQAPQAMQKTCADTFLNGQIADSRLSRKVAVIAASNERHDKCGVIELLEHVKNRMGHCVLLPPSARQWVDWAKSKDVLNEDGSIKKSRIDPRILMFIASCPDQLYQPVGNRKEDAFPTPRSWALTSDLINDVDHEREKTFFLRLVASRVGSGPAAKFKAVLDHDMATLGPQMFQNPQLFRDSAWDRKVAFGMWMSGNAKGGGTPLLNACRFLDDLGSHDMMDTLLYMMKSTVGTAFLKEIAKISQYPNARQALVEMAGHLGAA